MGEDDPKHSIRPDMRLRTIERYVAMREVISLQMTVPERNVRAAAVRPPGVDQQRFIGGQEVWSHAVRSIRRSERVVPRWDGRRERIDVSRDECGLLARAGPRLVE
jgi:hypothetical protein